MKTTPRFVLFLMASFFLGSVLWGADVPANGELEKEAKVLEGLLIAPCCWRQPVSVHFSPAADEIRTEVREMLSSGLTRDEILGKYIAEYGERILAKPPAEGFGSLAYFLPVIFLAAGASLAVVVVKKLRPAAKKEKAAPSRSSKIDADYARKLKEEMWG